MMIPDLKTRIRSPVRLTHVNNLKHHCKRQRRFAPTYSHRVGTAYSHRRNTHTECLPFFGNRVSSTIQAFTAPCFCIAGKT